MTSPIKGRDTQLLARDFLSSIRKKQNRWIRPVKKQDETIEREKLGEVDWDIPGHQRILAIPQAKDIVEWSKNLRLIDVKGARAIWSSLGKILSRITTQDQRNVFLCHKELPNPLRLTLRQKIFFLYLILKQDGDFMVPFMRKLPRNKKFLATESVNNFSATWQEVAERLQSSKEYSDVTEGKRLSWSIDELKDVSAYERVKSKLENLVDLDILTRANERNYTYLSNVEKLNKLDKLTSEIEQATGVSSEEAWISFFENSFFSHAADIFEIEARNATQENVTKRVLEAYSDLVGGLGLCRIDEICLLAGIDGISSSKPVIIEQEESRKAIYDLNKKHRKLASLHVDMLGNVSYVKIDKSILDSV